MDVISNISIIKRVFLIFTLAFSFCISQAQQTPFNPISYWIFTPSIYNPAIVGSSDFLSINLNTAFQGKSNAQILSGNTRISKTRTGYFTSPDITEYNNIGIGGSIFNNYNGSSRNFGISASGSYQIPLNARKLSFLSLGTSIKGVFNSIDSSTVESVNTLTKTTYPDLDLGIYYFGPNFFTGLSVTNLLRNPENTDSLGIFQIHASRQYLFTAGYKILLNRSFNIVLEPSILINAYDSTLNNIQDNLNPILKLYIENFCIGSYFLSDGNTSFFFQYRYPRFYIGAFYELPKKSPYYKRIPLVEFTLGINIPNDKTRFSKHSRW